LYVAVGLGWVDFIFLPRCFIAYLHFFGFFQPIFIIKSRINEIIVQRNFQWGNINNT
jgi:hypothetical protein